MARALAPLGDPDELVSTAMAPVSQSAFTEARFRRVREVDDATMAHLMRLLLRLRRIKHSLGLAGVAGGALIFGVLPIANPIYAALIYGTLAAIIGMPTFATGTLAVRRIFLKEAMRLGLSRSTAMLLLTRAEKRARWMRPFGATSQRIEQLIEAVHEWDEA
jgi:hypothetical protein